MRDAGGEGGVRGAGGEGGVRGAGGEIRGSCKSAYVCYKWVERTVLWLSVDVITIRRSGVMLISNDRMRQSYGRRSYLRQLGAPHGGGSCV